MIVIVQCSSNISALNSGKNDFKEVQVSHDASYAFKLDFSTCKFKMNKLAAVWCIAVWEKNTIVESL